MNNSKKLRSSRSVDELVKEYIDLLYFLPTEKMELENIQRIENY
jgi:hypothetical protein